MSSISVLRRFAPTFSMDLRTRWLSAFAPPIVRSNRQKSGVNGVVVRSVVMVS